MPVVHNNTHEGFVSSNFRTRPISNIEAHNQYNHQIHLHQPIIKTKSIYDITETQSLISDITEKINR